MTARHEPDPPLSSRYDGIVCDLDGVVYRGHDAVPYAVPALERAVAEGARLVFATNNASRPPDEVAVQLRALGLSTSASSIVTSSQAGAHFLADDLAPGSPVLAVGGPGVSLALLEAGLRPVDTTQAQSERVMAVLQGYGANVGWHDLAEAAYAVSAGARWVATNVDSTLPTARGTAPGNGALVAAVQAAVSERPSVVGKPNTPLYELSAQVLGSSRERTLAIGDRLDTDIAGAVRAGIDSLFVLGGVHGVRDVAQAEQACRPTYLGIDLRCLSEPYPLVLPVTDADHGVIGRERGREHERERERERGPGRERGRGRGRGPGERLDAPEGRPVADSQPNPSQGDGWRCGAALARVGHDGSLRVAGGGAAGELLRVVVAACWQAMDSGLPLPEPDDGGWEGLSRRIADTRGPAPTR